MSRCCPNDTHRAMVASDAAWSGLRFIGVQVVDESTGEYLELRNCQCGSTLAREMTKEAA